MIQRMKVNRFSSREWFELYVVSSLTKFIRWILLSIACFTDLLRSIDECDDLEVECSSQESSDTEISDDEQSIVQEPLKEDQTERVSFLAALFKKNFSKVKKPPKPKVKAVSSSEYGKLKFVKRWFLCRQCFSNL